MKIKESPLSKVDRVLFDLEQNNLLLNKKGALNHGYAKIILMRLKDEILNLNNLGFTPIQILIALKGQDYFVKRYISVKTFHTFYAKYILNK